MSMELFAALIVLVSGFLFSIQAPFAYFYQQRYTGWTLYLYYAIWGIAFGTVPTILFFLTVDDDSPALTVTMWTIVYGFLTVVFAGITGYCVLIVSKRKKLSFKSLLVGAKDDDLKEKIFLALKSRQYVLVTLKNRKVYAGVPYNIESLLKPKLDFIKICPIQSGYRKQDDLVVVFTNQYSIRYGFAGQGA